MQLGKTFKEIRKRSKRFPEMLTSFGANVPVFSAKRSLLFGQTQVCFRKSQALGGKKPSSGALFPPDGAEKRKAESAERRIFDPFDSIISDCCYN